MSSLGRSGNTTKVSEQYNVGAGGGLRTTYDKVYLGFVKSTYDVMSMGRIKVYIPELCGNMDDPNTWIPCDYASPFAGATDITQTNKNANSSQVSYGMSFIPPDVNNQVLVMFINGDPNRGFWFACLFQVNANRMVPSTPAASPESKEARKLLVTGAPLFPTFAPAAIASADSARSSEPTSSGGAATESMGTGGTKGNPTLGIRTPSGHSITFEDSRTDGFVRLQSRNGAQILMHTNTDRIIINTGSGYSRIEMDREGNIDIVTKQSLSVRSDLDINFSAKRDINISAQRNFNTQSYGETKLFSQNKFHIKNDEGGMFIQTNGEMHRTANGSIFDDSTRSIYRKSLLGIYDTTTNGPIEIYAHGNIRQYAHTGAVDILSDSNIHFHAQGGGMYIKSATSMYLSSDGGSLYLKSAEDTRIQSDANINLLSKTNILISSSTKDVNIRSVTGSMFIQSVGDANIKSGNSVVIQGNNNVDLKPGSGSVRTTKSIIINAGTIPDAQPSAIAGESTAAQKASPATPVPFPPVGASSPENRQHINIYTASNVASGRRTETVNSIVSRMPSADPSPTRTILGAGFRKIVTRKDAPPESAYKIGEIFQNQPQPLQTIGMISAISNKIGRYTGKGWDSNGVAQYDYSPMPDAEFKPASEWTTSETGLETIQSHEGTGGVSPYRPGLVFPDVCNSGQLLIGHGHILTSDEIQNKQIVVGTQSVAITVDPAITTTTIECQGLSEDQMKLLLKSDVKPIEDKIKSAVGRMKMTQQQFDALVDFVYNVGEDAFMKSGGVADLIKNGKYNEVINEMIRWIIACGTERPELKTRRQNNALAWSGRVRGDMSSLTSQPIGGRGTSNMKAVNSANTKTIYCSLLQAGYSPIAASGIVGNLIQESSGDKGPLDPTVSGDAGAALGIAQWHPERRRAIAREFGSFDSSGYNETTVKNQTRYIIWELNNSEKNAKNEVVSATDPSAAADAINMYYERSQAGQALRTMPIDQIPGNLLDDIGNRRQNAIAVYNRFANDPNACSV